MLSPPVPAKTAGQGVESQRVVCLGLAIRYPFGSRRNAGPSDRP
jgi:hypothetical protein